MKIKKKQIFFAILFIAWGIIFYRARNPLYTAYKLNEDRYGYTPIPVFVNNLEKDKTLEELEQLNGGSIKVSYLDDSNIIKEIQGKFSSKKIFTVQDALSALYGVHTLMNIQDFSFTCAQATERGNTKFFEFNQLYKRHKVLNGSFQIAAAKDGTPLYVSGQYIPGIDIELRGLSLFSFIPLKNFMDKENVIRQEPFVTPEGIIWQFVVQDSHSSDIYCVYYDSWVTLMDKYEVLK